MDVFFEYVCVIVLVSGPLVVVALHLDRNGIVSGVAARPFLCQSDHRV